MTTTNNAELELQYMRLKQLSLDLTQLEIDEERKSNNAIKIAKIRKKNVEIIREYRELEKVILEDQEIPERIFRFGQCYIAEQEIRK